MRRALAVLTLVLAAGCGGESGDLLALEIAGGSAPEDLRIVVTGDGRGRCNDGPLRPVASERLIEARELERDAGELARRAATYGADRGGERRTYVLRTRDGIVRWSEGEPGLPRVLPRAALLGLRLEQELCRRAT